MTHDVTDAQMKKLSKVSVRLLATVFDMLSVEEDPDKILEWIDNELERGGPPRPKKPRVLPVVKHSSATDHTNAIALFRELERKNRAMAEQFKELDEERKRKRDENAAASRQRREEAHAHLQAARRRAQEHGVDLCARDMLNSKDLRHVQRAFADVAATMQPQESAATPEGNQWWKQDSCRRDFEIYGRKGTLWTRMTDGGSTKAPESELNARQDWYQTAVWWKKSQYRSDWQATKNTEWWTEHQYYEDWRDNGGRGAMWKAIDEASGAARHGDRRMASQLELDARAAWYAGNGPTGVVKKWCALHEGSKDRCTLQQKLEREVYYRGGGDWWKSDASRRDVAAHGGQAAALHFSGAAGEDVEWWKQDEYHDAFNCGGSLWRAAAEDKPSVECAEAEAERRKEWFTANWWKAARFRGDFDKCGDSGTLWRVRSEADIRPGQAVKMCSAAEAALRAEWFKSSEDRAWWKAERFIRDYLQGGHRWEAAHCAAASTNPHASVETAPAPDLRLRKDWYAKNWWKIERCVKDFQRNGENGCVWKIAQLASDVEDGDWWKTGDAMRKYFASKATCATPFWQTPEAVADYQSHRDEGHPSRIWNAVHAAAVASSEESAGVTEMADTNELQRRCEWLDAHWWVSPSCLADFGAHGVKGTEWTAAGPRSSLRAPPSEIAKRSDVLRGMTTAWLTAALEIDARAAPRLPSAAAAPADVLYARDETLRREWWKGPSARADWTANGEQGHVWKAVCAEAAALGLSHDPCKQVSGEEAELRRQWFEAGCPVDNWWQDDEAFAEHATQRELQFWRNPEFIQDFLDGGHKWRTVDGIAAAAGQSATAVATPEDISQREVWYAENFWKSPMHQADFLANGERGVLWTTTAPGGKGATASDDELKARVAFYRPTARWQQKEQPSAPNADAVQQHLISRCDPEEQLRRSSWLDCNWWRAPDVREDFERNGMAGKLFSAKNRAAADMGLAGGDNGWYRASENEL